MRDSLRFLVAFAKNRSEVGAIMPSSNGLAKRMVQALGPIVPGQVVIELGAGTGVFTKRLRRSFPTTPILAIELDGKLAGIMRQRFPDVHVIEGCASCILDHLLEHGYQREQVAGVISGLPMLSLPHDIRDRIFSSIRDILLPGRRYIQFTYCRRAWDKFLPNGFCLGRTRRCLFNLPPAVVLPFERIAA